MEYKNNIFEVLKNIDKNNFSYYKTLLPEQKDELQPYTLLKWLSNTYDKNTDEYYTKMTQEMINKYYNKIEDKELLFQLLCCCGIGNYVKHKWIKGVVIPTIKKNKKKEFLRGKLGYKDYEFEMFYNSLNEYELESHLKIYGFYDK